MSFDVLPADTATKHTASIVNVAVRAILDRPVADVIIGCWLGAFNHAADNAAPPSSTLTALESEQFVVVRLFQLPNRAHQLLVLLDDLGDFHLPGGALDSQGL